MGRTELCQNLRDTKDIKQGRQLYGSQQTICYCFDKPFPLNLEALTPQNCQTHDELFECVWPFCGVGT